MGHRRRRGPAARRARRRGQAEGGNHGPQRGLHLWRTCWRQSRLDGCRRKRGRLGRGLSSCKCGRGRRRQIRQRGCGRCSSNLCRRRRRRSQDRLGRGRRQAGCCDNRPQRWLHLWRACGRQGWLDGCRRKRGRLGGGLGSCHCRRRRRCQIRQHSCGGRSSHLCRRRRRRSQNRLGRRRWQAGCCDDRPQRRLHLWRSCRRQGRLDSCRRKRSCCSRCLGAAHSRPRCRSQERLRQDRSRRRREGGRFCCRCCGRGRGRRRCTGLCGRRRRRCQKCRCLNSCRRWRVRRRLCGEGSRRGGNGRRQARRSGYFHWCRCEGGRQGGRGGCGLRHDG
jgi:hypothetical protein